MNISKIILLVGIFVLSYHTVTPRKGPSLKFLEQLAKVRSLTELDQKFLHVGAKNIKTNGNLFIIPPDCKLQDTIVDYPRHTNVNVVRWPMCTSVPRCSGCCGDASVECAPAPGGNTTKTIWLMELLYKSDTQISSQQVSRLEIEKHTACLCQCKIKQKDCNTRIHDYLAHDCRCRCKNEDDSLTGPSSCRYASRWDGKQCKCVQDTDPSCLSGFEYDSSTCKCRQSKDIRTGRRRPLITQAPRVQTTKNPCLYQPCSPSEEGCEIVNRRTRGKMCSCCPLPIYRPIAQPVRRGRK